MQAKSFLFINGIIVFFLILRLVLGAKRARLSPLEPLQPDPFGGAAFSGLGDTPPKTKTLNCIFMFQAHTFDAFEVLGVPAGSNKEACREAYAKMLQANPDSREFYDLAWRALEKHFLG